ncbi:hypothetical protein ASE63_18440 [Bosea sp. Root381]|uniref:helix-turn-helix domain-containing protein n=1 Tax=Bosea sp. Root381 TaxID=1736524 RepID=UPI0006F625AB|nr:helix-turn-helix domain-containing protein [Bosea sp. Root381]KRE13452.1 hypothetical protein ASE63_18440 [Bosea sp. Root381]
MTGKLLTMGQLAEHLSVSQRHIRNLMKEGAIVGINVGTHGRPSWRFDQQEVQAFLQRRRIIAPQPKPLRSSVKAAPPFEFEVIDFHQRHLDTLSAKAAAREKAKAQKEADRARRRPKRRAPEPEGA